MRLLALVPAYNEEGNIGKLIEGLRAELPEADILVINDCSTDGTERILAGTEGIRYLDLPFNMGIGGAVLSGFTYFLENGYDLLVRLDGDGQHPPSEAGKLVSALQEEGVDAVIGSRYLAEDAAYSSKTRMLGIFVVFTLIAIFGGLLDSISAFFGILYPPAALFIVLLTGVFLLLLYFSVVISELKRKLNELAVRNAILDEKIRSIEEGNERD